MELLCSKNLYMSADDQDDEAGELVFIARKVYQVVDMESSDKEEWSLIDESDDEHYLGEWAEYFDVI